MKGALQVKPETGRLPADFVQHGRLHLALLTLTDLARADHARLLVERNALKFTRQAFFFAGFFETLQKLIQRLRAARLDLDHESHVLVRSNEFPNGGKESSREPLNYQGAGMAVVAVRNISYSPVVRSTRPQDGLTKETTMAASADVQHVTNDNFETFKKGKVGLLDFSATWCGPCQVLGPIVDKLATEFKGKVNVGKVDIDEDPDLAGQFGVMAVPTLVFFKDGKVVDQHAGLLPEGTLRQRLTKLLG